MAPRAGAGAQSLFTPLASTPDELLAVILVDSSLLALVDYVQIISCSAHSKGNIQDFGERFGEITFECGDNIIS